MTVHKAIKALILFSLVTAFVAFVLAFLSYRGLFTEWKQIEPPSNTDKVVKVLDIGYVQTESGAIYKYHPSLNIRFTQSYWESAGYSLESAQAKFPINKCDTFVFLPLFKSSFVDTTKACIPVVMGRALTAYAIDEDGRVYLWMNINGGTYPGIEHVILPIIGGVLGSILAIVYITITVLSRRFGAKQAI